MSQRDHGVMEPAATPEPYSVPASPPARDSMEDADPSLTRKRPRLDSGSEGTLAMPAEQTPSQTTPAPAHDNQVEMTIRSQPASSSHAADGAGDTHLPATPPPADSVEIEPTTVIADIEPADEDTADSPPVIAIDDDDSDAMVGDTVPSAMQLEYEAEVYFHRFPFAQHGHYLQAVHSIAQHFRDNQALDGTVLPQLTIWLDNLKVTPIYWKSHILDKHAFWDEFAAMVHRILLRRAPFGDSFCDEGQAEEEVFIAFLAAYFRICVVLMEVDADALERWSADANPPIVVSCKHIRHIYLVLRTEKISVLLLLERDYGADLRGMTFQLMAEFVRAEGIKSLFGFAEMIRGEAASNVPQSVAVWIAQLLDVLGWLLPDIMELEPNLDRSEFNQDVLQFFRAYNADLQVPSRVLDHAHAKDMIHTMSCLLQDLCIWDGAIAAKLADQTLDFRDPDSPVTPILPDSRTSEANATYLQDPAIFPALVMNAWKFKLLRKYVVKGRMELRVMSIGTMDNALVEIWKEYNQSPLGASHPVMQYLAEFLLHERVTDYIISVDSHPQLISRSGNVVGFLVVTHRYSKNQTDVIWNTVSNSPDPRVVSATMTMLRNIFGLMDIPELLYLCTKLYELPIESYNLDIVRFLRELTGRIQQKYPDWSEVEHQARPWNVVVRLLQDTSPGKDAGKSFYSMHNEAYEQLHSIASSIGPVERHDICRRCAAEIASRSSKATGSVRAIYVVLTCMLHLRDGRFFTENPEISRQIIEETCAFVKEVDDITATQAHALQYRLELLSFIISHASDAIPADIYQDMWDHLIGKYAQTNQLRDMAWSKFLEASRYNAGSSFFQQLVTSYVPNLEPQYYTVGLYDFVAAFKFPKLKRIVTTPEGDRELLQIRGADLLWSMVLSAPPHTIEDHAAKLLASRYLELGTEPDVALEEVEAAHVALVEQCMQELSSAYQVLRGRIAPREDDQMDVALSEPTRQQNERRFTRTIIFLKGLLISIRTRKEFSHERRSDSKVDPSDLDLPYGDAVEIRYQAPMIQEKQSILVGSENTLIDLHSRLCQATGYSKINLFARGAKLKLDEKGHQTIADLGLGSTFLLVQKAPGSEVTQPMTEPSRHCSVFERSLVDRFEELFGYMDGNDSISQVLYDLLLCFPYPERIPKSVETGTGSVDHLFPPRRPYQAKYTAHVLQWRLKEQVRKNTLGDEFLANTVRLLDQALLDPSIIAGTSSKGNGLHLAGVLVTTLLDFLKERPAPEISAAYFSDEVRLVERLLHILSLALESMALQTMNFDPSVIVYHCYASIVEASLHSRRIWEAFTGDDNIVNLHKALLLENPRQHLREYVVRVISSVCGGALPPSSAITESDTVTSFWTIISLVLPAATRFPAHCEQLLEIADQVFRKYDENNRNEETLRSYLSNWSDMLLAYNHVEHVGRDEVDFAVLGFTKLLLSCISSLRSFKKPLNSGSLVEKVWHKFLFVPRVLRLDEQESHPSLPVLESKTRRELYDLVIALAEDRISYCTLVELAKDVGKEALHAMQYHSPCPYHIFSELLTSSFKDVQADPYIAFEESEMAVRPICIDRANEIRSPTGYVGLYNPRAICYMNSLLTQLFMNVNFRKFMLGLNIADRGASQRLLHETQKLFTNLQNSYRKAADPRGFASCVKVPEGLPIDINVQMDADEFYNLLFDQWETQMLSPEVRQQFRKFYGGHTVNQIKSKECEHVSERVESFFVVQCDVQGKSNLIESLQSYVEGDVMEGDNKYKCESCGGKLVDAIKRTCLKDVPDNLMFHLKRFDFDLVEMRRSKINDQFEFPSVIDMSPFKIDHLSDPSRPCKEDVFELVGVLVHQGTSENGHYYSYIRERPSPSESRTQWFEFNDREVEPFDHQMIPQSAFGGFFEETYPRQHKNYSAYMLFYQRRSALQKDHDEYMGSPSPGIAKVPIPFALDSAVRDENETFIREYSLYDPCHAKFARQVLANVRVINHGTCSEGHEQESLALQFVLEYLCQTLFRVRHAEVLDELFPQLRRTMLSCPTCCEIALKWLAAHEYALANVILQCLHAKVRSQMRALLFDSLQFLRDKDPAAYGLEGIDTDTETGTTTPTSGLFYDIVRRLQAVAEESHLAPRGWDDLYLMLCQLSDMGPVETAVILNQGFLDSGLRIFCMHANQVLRAREPEMWRVVEKKRRIYNRLIEFVYTLLSKVDINLPAVLDGRQSNRLEAYDRQGAKFALSREEKFLLHLWYEENRALAALDKMLELFDHEKTEVYYPGKIVECLVQSKDPRLLQNIHTTIFEGITMLQPPTSDPYVRAALSYCQSSNQPLYVEQVIDAVAKASSKLREFGGLATIQFLEGLLHADNEAIFDARGNDFFYEFCLYYSKKMAIPLLVFDDEYVRRATSNFLQQLFTNYKDDTLATENTLKFKYRAVRGLTSDMCTKIAEEHEQNTSRSYMQPMISVCQAFIRLLQLLQETDDPILEQWRLPNDPALIQECNFELNSHLRHWLLDEGTPVSTGEGYEQSDYGSESDVEDGILADM